MSLTQPVNPQELQNLHWRFGARPHEHVVLEVDEPFLNGRHQTLLRDGRRAEICYILHRGNPDNGVLLHVKHYYPTGAYRLPTGGVHPGDGVLDTLAREVYEETGLTVGSGSHKATVEAYLGCLSYDLRHRTLGRIFPFATYHFLVRAPQHAVITVRDESEQILDWQWRPAGDLARVADFLDGLQGPQQDWRHWGRFRALSHRFVLLRLAPEALPLDPGPGPR